MLTPFLGLDASLPSGWDELRHGVPTVRALAHLAARALVDPVPSGDSTGDRRSSSESLSPEAEAILVAARGRTLIEVKPSPQQFRTAERVLAVFVEREEGVSLPLRDPSDPRPGLRFLEAFAELCARGLVVHHVQFEFTLTSAGLRLADGLDGPGRQSLLAAVGWPPEGVPVEDGFPDGSPP